MRRRIRLSESSLHRIIKESVKRILREAMSATENPNWLDSDEYYFDNDEVPELHNGDISYPNYEIPNNYGDYYGFDEDGLNGKTDRSLTSQDSSDDAWNFYDGKKYVMHRGQGWDDFDYVKRMENPNMVIPEDEIYRRIGNPSQYDTYVQ